MVAILMMPLKLATLGLLKINLFWEKVCNVTIFAHDVTNKILLLQSNFIVDMAMWQKFGKFIREVIITSIL